MSAANPYPWLESLRRHLEGMEADRIPGSSWTVERWREALALMDEGAEWRLLKAVADGELAKQADAAALHHYEGGPGDPDAGYWNWRAWDHGGRCYVFTNKPEWDGSEWAYPDSCVGHDYASQPRNDDPCKAGMIIAIGQNHAAAYEEVGFGD